MTGPEHYREAERLLTVGVGQRGSPLDATCTAAAQVHATLALAAASVIAALHSSAQFRAWREAVGDKEVPGDQ